VIAMRARNVARCRKKKRGPDRLASNGAASTSGAFLCPSKEWLPNLASRANFSSSFVIDLDAARKRNG
jgi:hypothetical protein